MARNYSVVSLEHAEPRTFELISPDGDYARDAQRVFYLGVPIAEADPATFQLMKSGFAKDARHAYIGTAKLQVEDIASWQPLFPAAAGKGFWHPRYSKDRLNVYWEDKILAGADAASFVPLADNYAKDEQQVYFFGKTVPEADAATFEVYSHSQGRQPDARDGEREYRSGEAVSK